MMLSEGGLDCATNSLCQHLCKCTENSMENMHTDIWVNMYQTSYLFRYGAPNKIPGCLISKVIKKKYIQ